jgi:hypothetical protein
MNSVLVKENSLSGLQSVHHTVYTVVLCASVFILKVLGDWCSFATYCFPNITQLRISEASLKSMNNNMPYRNMFIWSIQELFSQQPACSRRSPQARWLSSLQRLNYFDRCCSRLCVNPYDSAQIRKKTITQIGLILIIRNSQKLSHFCSSSIISYLAWSVYTGWFVGTTCTTRL